MKILDPIQQILVWLHTGAVFYLDDPEQLRRLLKVSVPVYGAIVIAHWRENGDGSSEWSQYFIRLSYLPKEELVRLSSEGWLLQCLSDPGDVPSQAISLVARDEKRNGPMTFWVSERPEELVELARRAGMTVCKRGEEIAEIFARLVIRQ